MRPLHPMAVLAVLVVPFIRFPIVFQRPDLVEPEVFAVPGPIPSIVQFVRNVVHGPAAIEQFENELHDLGFFFVDYKTARPSR